MSKRALVAASLSLFACGSGPASEVNNVLGREDFLGRLQSLEGDTFVQTRAAGTLSPQLARFFVENRHHQQHHGKLGSALGHESERDAELARVMLQALDHINQRHPDGGTYSLAADATPTRWDLALFGHPLSLGFSRSSYCTGAVYSAFVTFFNLLFPGSAALRDALNVHLSAFEMQRPDPSGRLVMKKDYDGVWGWFNGASLHVPLVKIMGVAKDVRPDQLQPGDLLQLWRWDQKRSGIRSGHQVVFLGYGKDAAGEPVIHYWSSNPTTNGFGDESEPLSRMAYMEGVRIVSPLAVRQFDARKLDEELPGFQNHLWQHAYVSDAVRARIRAQLAP